MSRCLKWPVSIAIAAGVAVLVTTVPDLAARMAYASDSKRAARAVGRLSSVNDLSTAFGEVAEVIKPSVVNINSVKRVRVGGLSGNFGNPFFNSPFRDFFGDDFFNNFFQTPAPRQREYVQQGLGTGVIVTEDGYILTNNHVVQDADEVTVKLSDDRSYTAKVVGTDPKTDLAVIKIDAGGLYPARLGDSEELRIGEWVVAAGNPFGLAHTITSGIVSAKGRSNVGIADYEDFIQTDAAINPGNSGGPLVNLKGEVVGINAAIFTRSGGYMGIGFAIPINMARSVMESLIETGRVVRGWLGVTIQDLDPGLAGSFGYEGTQGALVNDVTRDGPAERGGLRQGDIVMEYNGRRIEKVAQLSSAVAETRPGTKAKLKVFRDGKARTMNIEIGELETQVSSAEGRESSVDLGMTVKTLTPDVARRLGYEAVRGVLVTSVEPYGVAARAGIRVNDLILRVQGASIEDVSEFRRELGRHDVENGVRLVVQSGAMQRFVFMKAN